MGEHRALARAHDGGAERLAELQRELAQQAEQLSRARRGFFRIPGHRGLGLGLPIAGSILELGGGALGIEDLEEGMVFSLQLCAPDARRVRPARVTEVKKTA